MSRCKVQQGNKPVKTKKWVNLRLHDRTEKCNNLDKTYLKTLENPQGEVQIVLIPKSDHHIIDCANAKAEVLEKLKQFRTYNEVPDKG